MNKEIDFKDKLILVYFNGLNGNYNPIDIIMLLRINYENFYERITNLISKEFLIEGEYILEISQKGKDLLFSEYLNNIDFTLLSEESDLEIEEFNKTKEADQIIYIPKDFHKKV